MRISATVLEAFRLYIDPGQEWFTQEKLIAQIMHTEPPSPKRDLGVAFGRVLEKPKQFKVRGGYHCDGYWFDDEAMRVPFSLMDYKRGVFEVKGTKAYGAATVVCKADQIVGAEIKEHKTSDSWQGTERYMDSYQWRYELDILAGAVSVTYLVFVLDDHGNGVVQFKDAHKVTVYPYPEMHDDCARLVDQFVEWADYAGVGNALRQHTGTP